MSSEIAGRILSRAVDPVNRLSTDKIVDEELAEVRNSYRGLAIRFHLYHQKRDLTHGSVEMCHHADCKALAQLLRSLDPKGTKE